MFNCLAEYLDFYAINRAQKVLMADDECEMTFAATAKAVNSLAAAMQKKDLRKGERIVLLGKNSVNHLLVYLACSKLGVVPVGLNYRLSPAEWNYIVEDAAARLIFADAEFATQLAGAVAALPRVCIFGEADGAEHIDTLIKDVATPQCDETIELDDVLFQMYTSGTTGHPKGVLLTHRNVIVNMFQPIFTTGYFPMDDDKSLIIAPMYHAAGLISALCSVIYGSSMFIHRDYDPVRTITDIPEKKITALTAIPVMLQFSIACVPDIRNYDFSSLRCISYGASPIAVDLLKECLDILQCDFSQVYGQTESAGGLTCLTPDDHRRALAEKPELLLSCGRPILGTQMCVVDADDQPLPVGETGEVVARGTQVMQGYWHLEEASRETLANGWLHTGDAGFVDEEGYFYLCDRIKDIIISGGENIYPAEVEKVILEHPAISEAAIIGVADAKWGEVPLLVAVVSPEETLDLAALDAFCRPRMAAYKIPKHIECVAALPRNPTGKILKKELRQQFCEKYAG